MQSKVNEMKTRFQKLQQEEEEAKNALKQKNFEYENDFKDMENQLSRRYHRILELEKYKKNFEETISKSNSNKQQSPIKKDQYGISQSSRKSDQHLNRSCSSCIKLQDKIAKQSSQSESRIKELEKQKLDYFNSLEEISQENEFLKSNDGKYGNRIRFYGSSGK